jgi:hypothetical protein
LFNGFIPIIAIQMSAIEVGDAVTLVFTTVLDRTTLGVEEDEEKDEPADRNYWLTRASAETLAITDGLLKIIQEVDPSIALKYNKHYIGLAHGGVASNYVAFGPRKKLPVLVEFKIARSDELNQRLEDAASRCLPIRPDTDSTESRLISRTLICAAISCETWPEWLTTPIAGRSLPPYRTPQQIRACKKRCTCKRSAETRTSMARASEACVTLPPRQQIHQSAPGAFNRSAQPRRVDGDFVDSVEESARMVAHLTVEQRQLALRLKARGLSLREIGREVGCFEMCS